MLQHRQLFYWRKNRNLVLSTFLAAIGRRTGKEKLPSIVFEVRTDDQAMSLCVIS